MRKPFSPPPSRALPIAFAMDPGLQHDLFDAGSLERLSRIATFDAASTITDFRSADPALLDRLQVLVTGWGAPAVGSAELELMPHLRAIVHAAGTVKEHVGPEVWDRGILVTTAAAANAYPVAEYTLAMILLSGKGVFPIAREYRLDPALDVAQRHPGIGNYRRTVGIIGASSVGRLVIELLAPFDFEVLLYDPVIDEGDPLLARVRRVGLDELFALSSIVSVHAPLLPETRGMVGARQLALLPPGATLINTARAPLVDQTALADAVAAGRLHAVLDVTDPEPLPAGDRLRTLPDVVLTPHVAGALGNELLRLGESAVLEVELLAAGRPAAFPIRKADLAARA
ncbi:MAG: hydroxyacid dehydrogenase [Actinobacteria bacterium]|nr:hydroxyacid dehydrogenase [Actinomycetota bacterium]